MWPELQHRMITSKSSSRITHQAAAHHTQASHLNTYCRLNAFISFVYHTPYNLTGLKSLRRPIYSSQAVAQADAQADAQAGAQAVAQAMSRPDI